jgi:predicted ferric reductase
MSLWLWFDYQADPAQSYLTLIGRGVVELMPAPLREFHTEQAYLMGLPLTGSTKAYWYMARAAGIVSYLLLWLSTLWGLMLSTKFISKRLPAPIIYGMHEFLAILSLVFMALHTFVLLGDDYIKFNLWHLAVPFIAPYQPFWTGLGTIGFYLSTAMTGSFYIRKQIGQKVWRILHYLTFITYLVALAHGAVAGTDSSLPSLKLVYLITGLAILFLVYYRLFTLKNK